MKNEKMILTIHCRSKRAAYKYAKDRGAVASRWCWLATQISELDYKIRQNADLRKHIRDNKGIVTLDAVGYEGHYDVGNKAAVYNVDSDTEDERTSSARCRPFSMTTFRKRKLVQIANLHLNSKKAARPR
jgi:KAT8 regulatory NSL complex subunit 1